MTRTFESGPARRARMPLMIAIVGASGSGKTLSALLLAEGIKRVQPGPIVVIDTESLRALKHSDGNPDRFVHVPFGEPFGPLDYIEAIKHALKHQPSTIIIDSMSHEWEGPGGVLAQHAAVVAARGESFKMTAWIKPKADHTALKHFILQQRCNWIFCFRAKEKIKPKKGGEPEDLGWQPLAAEDLIYEMDLCALLYPGVDGRPKWKSPQLHEQEIMKLPGWWRALFASEPQLNPDIGEQLARWAAGGDVAAPSPTATSSRQTSNPGASAAPTSPKDRAGAGGGLVERFDACTTVDQWKAIGAEMRAGWSKIPPAERQRVTLAEEQAKERIRRALAAAGGAPPPDEQQEEIRRKEAAATKE